MNYELIHIVYELKINTYYIWTMNEYILYMHYQWTHFIYEPWMNWMNIVYAIRMNTYCIWNINEYMLYMCTMNEYLVGKRSINIII